MFPVNFNGYFENEFFSEKNQNPVIWNLYNPRQYVEFKVTAKKRGSLFYLSFNAQSNSNSGKIYFNQGHLEYKKGNFSYVAFAREDRYWVQSPILFLINPDRVKDDAWGVKGEGVRMDFWKTYGFFGTGLVSKFKSWDGEAYIARMGKNFKRFMTLSYLYARKDWRGSGKSYNDINSVYLRAHIYRTIYLSFEGASSRHPNQDSLAGYMDKSAFQIEMRKLTFHGLNLSADYFNYGKYFIDELSNKFNPAYDHEFGRNGVYVEALYFVPYKAINLLYRFTKYNTFYDYPVLLNKQQSVFSNYAEVYTEFFGGVSAKIFYDQTRNQKGDWRHVFFQIQGENSRMKVKLQYKIKDIGINKGLKSNDFSIGQRELLGTEIWFNITDWLQFYTRGALGNGQGLNWESYFAQIGFRKFKNNEIFLEYGDPSGTDGDIVNDPDVADYPYQKISDRIKLFVKFWF